MYSQSPFFLLDAFSVEDLTAWEAQKDKILRYHWDLYHDLAYQRHKMADQLFKALLEATISHYEFNGWQRQVRYKYSLTPLSPKGSLIEPGGRFNIPDVNPDQIPPFPALYIGSSRIFLWSFMFMKLIINELIARFAISSLWLQSLLWSSLF